MLKIDNLSIALPAGADRPLAVNNVSFELAPGRTLCLVGESGSGKSVTGCAIAGLLPKFLRQSIKGSIRLGEIELTSLNERQWMTVRGREVGMIFQEPMTALNPIMPVGRQISEVFNAHGIVLSRAEMRDKVHGLLERVGIREPRRIADSYSFRISGGQRQRVMIAMAVALKPRLLIADEPTTALDVTTQAQVLELISDLQSETGMAVLFVTHDFGIVADIATDVAVMQHGNLIEIGTSGQVFEHPAQPYTRKLLAAVPRLGACRPCAAQRAVPLIEIAGLCKRYAVADGLLKRRQLVALNEVSFSVCKGEVVSLVGESGSGKSTIARCLTKLTPVNCGTIKLDGVDLFSLKGAALKHARRRIQIVFQDPYGSLDPRQKAIEAVAAGPIAHGTPRKRALEEAAELLSLVGLSPNVVERYPHEFSGGQRQRIGIARALAVKPDLLIADEAVSALDVTVQAQVLELLADLRDKLGLTMLFITHDLRIAAQVSDRIIVLQNGAIVEEGPTETIFAGPAQAYTRKLLGTIPGLNAGKHEGVADMPLGAGRLAI
ncbi:oligopeptide/dipeptide ABC transporter ATPase [Caballeronia pedi]|uniref:Oligopeptide/dipeptide ABC transporter ATPase n=1 Tax=Caballeronia pedi TaxID=1777141 RepID=A0A158DUE6_9BURK|nr:ABC transporter ATP-binding protein [Caballeronia pedi]SAK97337.1 oligopeptide/dipeptide ABC transporter ATPase [Caballeronia pedi]